MPLTLLNWAQALWSAGRKIEDLILATQKTSEVLQRLEDRVRAMEDRLLTLESGQMQIIVEAKSAAAGAATTMAAGALFEAATRIAQLEMRVSNLADRPALPPVPDHR